MATVTAALFSTGCDRRKPAAQLVAAARCTRNTHANLVEAMLGSGSSRPRLGLLGGKIKNRINQHPGASADPHLFSPQSGSIRDFQPQSLIPILLLIPTPRQRMPTLPVLAKFDYCGRMYVSKYAPGGKYRQIPFPSPFRLQIPFMLIWQLCLYWSASDGLLE